MSPRAKIGRRCVDGRADVPALVADGAARPRRNTASSKGVSRIGQACRHRAPACSAPLGCSRFFGAATLITAAIAGLAVVLDNVWAAALIVAAVLFIAAGVAAAIQQEASRRGRAAPADGRERAEGHRRSEGRTPLPDLIQTTPSGA